MTCKDILLILSENFCNSGMYDSNGDWRYINEGNTVYLIGKNNGYAYVFRGYNENTPCIIKYSIDNNGKMTNCGKFQKSNVFDIEKQLQKSIKFAIQPPTDNCISQYGKITPYNINTSVINFVWNDL